MTAQPVTLKTVNLDNCDKEPIHIPGSVQPHGVLIALDLAGRLSHASRNATSLFPRLPPLGEDPAAAHLWQDPTLRDAVDRMLREARAQSHVPPWTLEATVGGALHDVVLHANDGHVVLEFERRDAHASDLASFATLAYRSMSHLKGRLDIDSILAEAVLTVRQMTGFDRVTAYRFQPDDSGEIVAEAKTDEIDAYLGRRFPAADIPVQARRLYVINTLRLIAGVHDTQVPIAAHDPREKPLDLSHSILRSVSPIHIEYLKNINVAASMSISIVVAGRLWGLIACHHRSAHRVPYAVRMACDVLAHVVSSSVHLLLEKAAAARLSAAAALRSELVELGHQGDDVSVGFGLSQTAVGRMIASDCVLFSHGNQLRHEGVSTEAATELVRWLDAQREDLLALHELSSLPEPLRQLMAPLSGLLAMRYDRVNRGWIVLLRNEQAATVTWSGPPDKVTRVGPMGARLTPDGSLAEWQQEVRGSAVRWDDIDLALARDTLNVVTQAAAARAAEMEMARTHLLAILGHDLRDPLQSISMAALLLERGVDKVNIGKRITASSGRMARLIGQVLDMSRLHGGLGLGLNIVPTDLSSLVEGLVEESLLAYPNAPIKVHIPAPVQAEADGDRLAQVFSNLLGNARQHGTPGQEIIVRLGTTDGRVVLSIANVAPPLTPAIVVGLFDPLKRGSVANQRNPNGLGLGLYIASEAIKGHQGEILYRHDGHNVVFSVEFPLAQSNGAGSVSSPA